MMSAMVTLSPVELQQHLQSLSTQEGLQLCSKRGETDAS